MNCNYKVKITDIQTKYKFKVFCTGYDDSEIKEKIDAIYEAWPKVSAEGETPTLNNTANATMSIDLKGNTSQDGAPTPETPQDIHVVSGNNTIIVSNSDNTQSQSYSISLGNIELCEISSYKDKIYSNNGRFYLEKNTNKIILNGDETIEMFSVTGGKLFRCRDIAISVSDISPVSNYFMGVPNSASRYAETIYYNYSASADRMVFDILTTKFTTVAEFKSWLSTHNTELLFAIPRSSTTTTEITDATLISQLNALAGAESYSGQTNISQTNDDKPFILTAKALKDLSNL